MTITKFLKGVKHYFQSDLKLAETIKNRDLEALKIEISKKEVLNHEDLGKRGVFTHFLMTNPKQWGQGEYIEAFKLLISKIKLDEFYCAHIDLYDNGQDLMTAILKADLNSLTKKDLIEIIFDNGFNPTAHKGFERSELFDLGQIILNNMENSEYTQEVLALYFKKECYINSSTKKKINITVPGHYGIGIELPLKEALLYDCVSMNKLSKAKMLLNLGANCMIIDFYVSKFHKDNAHFFQVNNVSDLNEAAQYMVHTQNTIKEKQMLESSLVIPSIQIFDSNVIDVNQEEAGQNLGARASKEKERAFKV